MLGVAVTVAVFAGVGDYTSAERFSQGFSAGMTAVAAFAFTGVLVAAAMPGRRPATVAVPPPPTNVLPRGENAPRA